MPHVLTYLTFITFVYNNNNLSSGRNVVHVNPSVKKGSRAIIQMKGSRNKIRSQAHFCLNKSYGHDGVMVAMHNGLYTILGLSAGTMLWHMLGRFILLFF